MSRREPVDRRGAGEHRGDHHHPGGGQRQLPDPAPDARRRPRCRRRSLSGTAADRRAPPGRTPTRGSASTTPATSRPARARRRRRRRCSRRTRPRATRSATGPSYGRDALWAGGAATYLATGPTGSSASITGPRYLRTTATRRSATCARRRGRRRSRSTPRTRYRRIWDWKTASGGDGVGFLIDLTPSNQLRVITAGSGVTTNATIPTGRFINLVVTIGRDGVINVYVDGTRVGGGSYSSNFAIDGCAPAEIRIGADQGGGQRISAELDRTAMFTKALSEDRPRALAGDRVRGLGERGDADRRHRAAGPLALRSPSPRPTSARSGRASPRTTRRRSAATVTTSARQRDAERPRREHDGHRAIWSRAASCSRRPLQVRAGTGAFAPVGGANAPTPLLSCIRARRASTPSRSSSSSRSRPRTGSTRGAYGKTLTFTLSTTTP